jgi:hypothetical protein
MSNNLSEKSNQISTVSHNEEVDIITLFSMIGNAFSKLFKFIGNILKYLFSSIVFVLKAILDNYKIILIVLIISGALGYALEKVKPEIYNSQMLVKPYFDSKYQLVNNINYFNALIDNKDYNTLTSVFDISVEEAEMIKKFEINLGPESENDKIIQYDNFIKSIDSVMAQDISFDDFIDNRDIYSSDFFEISVESYKKDIFKSLEAGLNSSFENTYSAKKMRKRDSLIFIQKENIIQSIASVDSLQNVYIKVLEEESKSNTNQLSFGEGFTLEPANSKTKEYELLNKELQLRDQLRVLQEKKVEEDVFFDTVSGFQEVGSVSKTIFDKYSLIFPIASFLTLCLLFFGVRIARFVKSYEV